MSPIKVLIIDNGDPVYQKTDTLLKEAHHIDVVGRAWEMSKVTDIVHQLQPDVILLEIGRLYVRDLKAAIEQLLVARSQIKIIVLHQNGQEHQVLDAFRQGATGHLYSENTHPEEIITAIRAVHRGEVVLSPGMAGAILDEIVRKQGKNRNELFGETP